MKPLTIFCFVFAVCCPTLAQDRNIVTTKDSDTAITISGGVDMKYVYRGGLVSEMMRNINSGSDWIGGSGSISGQNFVQGRINLKFDVLLKEDINAILEIENRAIDGDTNGNGIIDENDNLVFADGPIRPEFKQVYVKFNNFLIDNFSLKFGSQGLMYKLRPAGEPFVIDLNEAESAYSLYNTDLTALRNSTDKDVLRPVGLKGRYDGDWWAMDLFFLRTIQRTNNVDSESLHGVFVEALPTPKLSLTGTIANISGEFSGSNLWIVGSGVDYNISEEVELFGEFYFNFGGIRKGIEKRNAYGTNFGARYVYMEKLWLETSYWYLSGDKNPTDGEDNSFQSYEGVDQFLIVEENELGLDIDTNYNALKVSGGYGPLTIGKEKNLLARIDIGLFNFNEPLYGPAGTKFISSQNIGTEVDVTLDCEYSQNTTFTIKAA